MSVLRRRTRRFRDECGMTLVELMIAAMIAAVGVGAVTTVLTGSRELTSSSERGDAAAYVAEREMERALSAPYDELALKQQPTTSSDPLDPRYHVSANGSDWDYRWDQASGGASPARVLVDPATGALDAPEPWNDGRLKGTIYRFVTVYDDPAVTPNDPEPPLLGLGDGKRVTVAVTVEGGPRPKKPVVLNSVVLP